MTLERLVRPPTPGDSSPAMYRSDRGTYLIQGYKPADRYRADAEDLAENEDLVEVPPVLIRMIREAEI